MIIKRSLFTILLAGLVWMGTTAPAWAQPFTIEGFMNIRPTAPWNYIPELQDPRMFLTAQAWPLGADTSIGKCCEVGRPGCTMCDSVRVTYNPVKTSYGLRYAITGIPAGQYRVGMFAMDSVGILSNGRRGRKILLAYATDSLAYVPYQADSSRARSITLGAGSTAQTGIDIYYAVDCPSARRVGGGTVRPRRPN